MKLIEFPDIVSQDNKSFLDTPGLQSSCETVHIIIGCFLFLTLSTNKYMQGAKVISTLALFQNRFGF